MSIFSAIASWVSATVFQSAIGAGVAFQTAAAVATGVGYATAAAVSIGISRALAPSVSVPKQTIQATIQQTDEPRRIYVGKNLVGGIRALFGTRGNDLYQLIVAAHGPIHSFEEFWIDSENVDLDASGNVTSGDAADFVNVQTRDGSGLGGDYSDLLSRFNYWSSDRELNGQATFLVKASAPGPSRFSKAFPKSYNTVFQWVIKGQEIYDPRDGDTNYSANAARVIAHYLTHDDGARMPYDDIDWDSVSAMADVCDIDIPQSGGGVKPNLRLWGYWTLDEAPTDVLDRMHSSSGIRVYETQEGKLGLIGGPYGRTACTLTHKDISAIETSDAIDEREGYNVLRVFHLDASQKYETIEVDPWRDEDRLEEEGEISKEYYLEMCPDLSQARRLAKQQMFDDNRPKVTITTNLVGLKARFPRYHGQRHTIMLDYRPEDGSGRVIAGEYEVINHNFDPIALECQIELARVDRASQEWDPSEEGQTTIDLPTDDGNPPPDISATLTQRVVQLTAGQYQAVLEVNAVPIPDRPDMSIQAQYRKTGASTWLDMIATDFSAESGAVEDGEEYEARVRFLGVFDGEDEWEMLGPITIEIDATAPGQPTELIPSNGTGYVHLSWRNPASTFYRARVYRNTLNDFGSASTVGTTGGVSGQISEFEDSTIAAATTYYYWVACANSSGVEGTPAGPATITTP